MSYPPAAGQMTGSLTDPVSRRAGTSGAVQWTRRARSRLAAEARRHLPLAGLPPGQRRARTVTAASALVVAVGLAAAPLAGAGSTTGLQALAGGAGVVALVVALLGYPAAIGWAVAVLAAGYGIGLAGRTGTDPAAGVEAAGLLLVAELAAWSLECRTRATDTAGIPAWRLRRLLLLEAAALLAGLAVTAAADLPARGGTSLGAIGVASAVAVLVIAAALLRRAQP
jgi:hypothetical protein